MRPRAAGHNTNSLPVTVGRLSCHTPHALGFILLQCTDNASMARLLIIAHAPLASAFLAVAQHAYPELAASAVRSFDVEPGMGADEVEAIARGLLRAGDEAAACRAAAPYAQLPPAGAPSAAPGVASGVTAATGAAPDSATARDVGDISGDTLVLTDVFGATPANAAQRLADGVHVRMLCGINVPMLWRALNYLSLPLNELVERSMSGAAQGVVSINSTRPQNQAFQPHANDAQLHHHQQ